jgi:hypothetical protein
LHVVEPKLNLNYHFTGKNNMTNDDLIKLGFKRIPHFTVTNSVVYPLGRHRHLSVGCAGTPNEIVFICETDDQDEKRVSDLICLHNYDHDGYLTEKKICSLINIITGIDHF